MFTDIRFLAGIGSLLIVIGLVSWAKIEQHEKQVWHDKYDTLSFEANQVLDVAKTAADNPDLVWRDVPEQIRQIGASRKEWKATSELQTARINDLGMETARLKALNDRLRQDAEAAIAKRDSAIKQLEDQALAPGDRANCQQQLQEAEKALDLIYQEGL